MRVVTLAENETEDKQLKGEHGLSLYIEHGDKKILFDIGQGKKFIKNAKKLDIDLTDIDYVVISHGHFDHGKNLAKFMKINDKAKVYVSQYAFDVKPYKNMKSLYLPIGIQKPDFDDRIVYVTEDIRIDTGIKIYADIPKTEQIITDNSLLVKTNEGYVEDDFRHEIYMVLYHSKQRVLFSGCSHKGIENIIDTIEARENKSFTAVVGGFHFSHYDATDLRQTVYLEELGTKFLKNEDTKYYTGHCTGEEAYTQLKGTMKTNINRMKTGTEFII
jgi:7,8-dihydropterin-6-yl-methyl-4-(beta-D-ribofuranosyl)aminobenzene 5'-phosphate synthase